MACVPEPAFVADREGRILLANEAATRLLGVGPGDGLDRALGRIASGEERASLLGALREVVEHGATHTVELAVRGASGDIVPTLLTAGALREAEGPVVGVIGILRDMREIQAQRATLERRAYTLERIVEERTCELRRASQAKDEFLAVLSHELRTPLTPILTWAQILRRERDAARIRQATDVIERNVRLQMSLVDDLLDLTRITQGTLTLDRERQDLRAMVGVAVGAIAGPAREKRIEVEWVPPVGPVAVEVDGRRMAQVLVNVLSNAVKFSPEGARIRVTVGQEREAALVRIKDEGAGIHPEFLPFVFEIFRQQEEGARRQYGGLGVGLALAKRLVNLHGGTIEVKSDGIGRGTEVVVRLPAWDERTPEPLRQAGGDGAPGRLDGLRILVVEDSVDTGDATRLLLESLGARVALAKNGLDGLIALAAEEVDAVVCDLRMPGLDGFEFLRRLRAEPGGDHLPVIAVSGFARAIDFQRTREAGFDGHVSKPFDYVTLLSALRRAIGDRQRRSTTT